VYAGPSKSGAAPERARLVLDGGGVDPSLGLRVPEPTRPLTTASGSTVTLRQRRAGNATSSGRSGAPRTLGNRPPRFGRQHSLAPHVDSPLNSSVTVHGRAPGSPREAVTLINDSFTTPTCATTPTTTTTTPGHARSRLPGGGTNRTGAERQRFPVAVSRDSRSRRERGGGGGAATPGVGGPPRTDATPIHNGVVPVVHTPDRRPARREWGSASVKPRDGAGRTRPTRSPRERRFQPGPHPVTFLTIGREAEWSAVLIAAAPRRRVDRNRPRPWPLTSSRRSPRRRPRLRLSASNRTRGRSGGRLRSRPYRFPARAQRRGAQSPQRSRTRCRSRLPDPVDRCEHPGDRRRYHHGPNVMDAPEGPARRPGLAGSVLVPAASRGFPGAKSTRVVFAGHIDDPLGRPRFPSPASVNCRAGAVNRRCTTTAPGSNVRFGGDGLALVLGSPKQRTPAVLTRPCTAGRPRSRGLGAAKLRPTACSHITLVTCAGTFQHSHWGPHDHRARRLRHAAIA